METVKLYSNRKFLNYSILGHITRSELRTAFQRMGHALTDQEIKAIYKHVDINNDGKINFQGADYYYSIILVYYKIFRILRNDDEKEAGLRRHHFVNYFQMCLNCNEA